MLRLVSFVRCKWEIVFFCFMILIYRNNVENQNTTVTSNGVCLAALAILTRCMQSKRTLMMRESIQCKTDLRKTPPSSDALMHSGGDSRRWISATVTLYLDVELSSDRRPGTVQNRSVGFNVSPAAPPARHHACSHFTFHDNNKSILSQMVKGFHT